MRDPKVLSFDEVEAIEKVSLRSLFLAASNFGFDAWDVFHQSTDDPKDVAEDVTREMLDRLGGYGISQRIYGNVDYRKARYVIFSEFAVRQALFVDSKAEKSSANATLQMSQLSMRVKQHRAGRDVDVPGTVGVAETYAAETYLTTILLAHYHYEAASSGSGKDLPPYRLIKLTLAAIPNGQLQARYNPDPSDSIWMAGRNAPTLGEDFRVRLSFRALRSKEQWRVQELTFDAKNKSVATNWSE
ncbi:MAG: SfiI family type II restriction endonuclease [Nitrososphaera sp.]|nr:SfiI family type II restriction endonuclease [Nitrososphaera sp.]